MSFHRLLVNAIKAQLDGIDSLDWLTFELYVRESLIRPHLTVDETTWLHSMVELNLATMWDHQVLYLNEVPHESQDIQPQDWILSSSLKMRASSIASQAIAN